MDISKIKQAIELTKLLDNSPLEECPCEQGEPRIVILQRGWVAVGLYYKEGPYCRLENAKIVRRWGTTKGLGELALNGPLSDTILDDSPTIKYHELTEVCSMICEAGKWKKVLK